MKERLSRLAWQVMSQWGISLARSGSLQKYTADCTGPGTGCGGVGQCERIPAQYYGVLLSMPSPAQYYGVLLSKPCFSVRRKSLQDTSGLSFWPVWQSNSGA